MGSLANYMTQIKHCKYYSEDEERKMAEEDLTLNFEEKLGKSLNGVFDAQIWAREFVKTVKEHPNIPADVDSMICWFANAIMAGYDEAYRRCKERLHD